MDKEIIDCLKTENFYKPQIGYISIVDNILILQS